MEVYSMEGHLSKQTVLVVDDQPLNVDILHDILRADYRVKVALNGEQALNLAISGAPPDLILLDIMMPGMDGYEVCRRLKINPLTRAIPLIFVTAMSDVIDESKGFDLGAVDYITKPVNPALVQARVRAQLALYDQSRRLEEMVHKRTEELQRANQRLIQERARFEWVVRTADDGYLILDRQGLVLFANPQARLYLGLPPDNAPITETFIELVKGQYQLETQEAWNTPLTQAVSQPRFLIRPESASAQAFWLSVDILEISLMEQEINWAVRLHDATDQITSRINWGTFSEMVNHKLRTPLTVVKASVEVLVRHSLDLPPEEVIETARFARKGVDRLHQTIEDVLAYIDAPKLAGSGEGFGFAELQPVAKEIADSLKIDHIGIACCAELKKSRVALSRRAMELILWELLENASKFHPRKSPIVELLVLQAKDGKAQLQVRDDGLTLSPSQLQKLWTPYYQGEKFFSGETPGMGLGLARVAALVWNVGGKCQAFNREDGPGIVVELHIPLAVS
jgi:two-component system cell cycle response regulator